MKTEQEQTKQMLKILCDKFQCSATNTSYMAKSCRQCEDIIEALHEAGYGDVSEYKVEIERLKEENKRAAISYTEYVLEEDTRFSVLRDNVAKLEQKNKRLCEENIEQYKKLKKQERKTVKQSQIDVLNKVKERAVGLAAIETYHICNLIDELINEVKNEQKD